MNSNNYSNQSLKPKYKQVVKTIPDIVLDNDEPEDSYHYNLNQLEDIGDRGYQRSKSRVIHVSTYCNFNFYWLGWDYITRVIIWRDLNRNDNTPILKNNNDSDSLSATNGLLAQFNVFNSDNYEVFSDTLFYVSENTTKIRPYSYRLNKEINVYYKDRMVLNETSGEEELEPGPPENPLMLSIYVNFQEDPESVGYKKASKKSNIHRSIHNNNNNNQQTNDSNGGGNNNDDRFESSPSSSAAFDWSYSYVFYNFVRN